MKLFPALALMLALAAPLPAMASEEPVATVTIKGILPYAEVGQSVTIENGKNGAPDTVGLGMIFVVVDADDPALKFMATVTSEFTDNGAPTGKWSAELTEKIE